VSHPYSHDTSSGLIRHDKAIPVSTLSLEKIHRIFERGRPVESDLSIASGERRDFFGERNEDHLLSPLEIRIDEAVQVTGKGRERRKRRKMQSHSAESLPWRSGVELCFGESVKVLQL
jgi:hypothetical protein